MPGGQTGALLMVFLIIFVLGFFLDTFEILFIVVPITAPVLLMMGVDPIWLGVMMGVLSRPRSSRRPSASRSSTCAAWRRRRSPRPRSTAARSPSSGSRSWRWRSCGSSPSGDLAPNELFRSDAPGVDGSAPPPAFDAGGGGEDEFL
jgi:hypothetical protein